MAGDADARKVAGVSREPIAPELLGHSLAMMERERAVWARELNDQTLQRLTAVRLTLSAARRRSPDDVRVTIERAIEMLADEIADLRARLARLRPLALDELGLAQALEGLALSHSAGGVDVRIDWSGDTGLVERLDPVLESALFRVAQEALANAAEHGRARRVQVRISSRDGVISMRVVDDGVGFDPKMAPQGLGLLGIGERVSLLAGELAVSSAPGSGTSVEARIPVGAEIAA
jgi:two-component system, NarL family, sensor histidine kinase DevS